VERFHGSLRREFLDHAGPFDDLAAAQAAIDAFVLEYNTTRPHQSLDMAFPADRFTARPPAATEPIPLRLPKFLTDQLTLSPIGPATEAPAATPEPAPSRWPGGPIEFDRVVPPSGNLHVAGKQFWLGPIRSGLTVTFWADTDVIHLSIAGARVKSVRSHLSVNHLTQLLRDGGRPAGPPPVPSLPFTGPVEVDRTASTAGTVSLGQHLVLAAEILAGRRVGIRVDEHTLMFFDPDTRELLRTRPNPLSPAEIARLRSARPAGPPPQPSAGPSASNAGPATAA
jgi:hypothetical protein